MDVARAGLDVAAQRVGAAKAVHLVESDVLDWRPDRPYDLWHDRALFHFLVDVADQRRYVEAASGALGPNGVVVLGCFAVDGPPSCSGLPVARHAPADLAAIFAPSFTLEASEREVHHTPWGAQQPFTWVVLRRG